MKPTDQERGLATLAPSFTLTFTGREVIFLLNTLAKPLWFEDGDGEDSFKRLRIGLIKQLEKAYFDD